MIERVLTAAVPAAAVVAVSWSSGGCFPRTWGAILLAEAIALAAVAILATRVEVGPREVIVVAALVGLAVWQLVSRAWAVAPDATILEAERTLLYAGAAASAFLAVTRDRSEELVAGVLAGAGVATLGGLAEHVLGSGTAGERLELPIGYANAAGILAATTLLLGLGLSCDVTGRRRGLAASLCPPAAAALYLSLSRGSLVAAAIGLAVLVVTARSTVRLARLGIVTVPAALAFVLAARVGRFDDTGATAAEVGSLLALALLCLVAALLAAKPPRMSVPHVSRRAAIMLAAVGGVLVVVGITVTGVREVRNGRSAPASQQGAPDRLLSTSTSFRSDYWDVAVAMARDAPLVGEGAGGFERTWLRERPALLYVRDAHNLYLETLAEIGVVGLVLLLTAPARAALGCRARARAPAGAAAPCGLRRSPRPCLSSTGTAVTLCLALAGGTGGEGCCSASRRWSRCRALLRRGRRGSGRGVPPAPAAQDA